MALPWRLSSRDERARYQPAMKSIDLFLDSRDELTTCWLPTSDGERSWSTVADLVAISTASTWWRTIITSRCPCEQALLLRSYLLRGSLRGMRPTFRWTPEERRCDGPACTKATDEWVRRGGPDHRIAGYPSVSSVLGSERIEIFRGRLPQYPYVACSLRCGERLKVRLLACADTPTIILSDRWHPGVDCPGNVETAALLY